MNRRLQMPCYAPTGVFIGKESRRISTYKHHISYGIWMFGALAFVLLSLRAPAREWAPILAVTLLLGGLYWRWSYLSNQLRDVWIRDYVLSDAVDLAWMEWIKDLEPRIDAMLEKCRPDARYTAHDFQKAFSAYGYYRDLAQRAGMRSEDAWADYMESLEERRDRERIARRRLRK